MLILKPNDASSFCSLFFLTATVFEARFQNRVSRGSAGFDTPVLFKDMKPLTTRGGRPREAEEFSDVAMKAPQGGQSSAPPKSSSCNRFGRRGTLKCSSCRVCHKKVSCFDFPNLSV